MSFVSFVVDTKCGNESCSISLSARGSGEYILLYCLVNLYYHMKSSILEYIEITELCNLYTEGRNKLAIPILYNMDVLLLL